VLLYCTTEEKYTIKEKIGHITYIDETVSPQSLRNLDDCADGRYRLLVAD